MGGAAGTGLRMQILLRAAHRALHVHVERHGIRAAWTLTGDSCWWWGGYKTTWKSLTVTQWAGQIRDVVAIKFTDS